VQEFHLLGASGIALGVRGLSPPVWNFTTPQRIRLNYIRAGLCPAPAKLFWKKVWIKKP
jgi:hypothetical protein